MIDKLPYADPENVGISSERLKRIQPVIKDYIDQQLIPGAVTMVARHGKIVHFDVQGYQNVKKADPNGNDLLTWPAYDDSDHLMDLGEEIKAIKHPAAEHCEIFQELNLRGSFIFFVYN